MTTRPVAVLLGHSTAVLDVAVYQPAGQIFSYSRDAVSHKVISNKFTFLIVNYLNSFFFISLW